MKTPMTPGASRVPAHLIVSLALAGSVLLPGAASASSWGEAARSLRRREIAAEEAASRGEEYRERRNKLSIRRIRPAMPGVDWDTDPTAIPYFLYQVNKRTDLPVYVDNAGLDVASPELFDYTVVYLTAHTAWGFDEHETRNMRLFLERGGTLYLDDCQRLGSPFTDSTFSEVPRLITGAEPQMALPEDPLIRDMFTLVYPDALWTTDVAYTRHWQYFTLQGRPAVFFSPNDEGCAWEVSAPPSAANPIGEPIGHGGDNKYREWAYQISTSFLLYVMMH